MKTIYRAWKAGRLSATRTDTGQIEVDPAELPGLPPIRVATGRARRRRTMAHKPMQKTTMHCVTMR